MNYFYITLLLRPTFQDPTNNVTYTITSRKKKDILVYPYTCI